MAMKDDSVGEAGLTGGASVGAGQAGQSGAGASPKPVAAATRSAATSSSERSKLDREIEATREWVRSGKDQAVDQAKSVVRDLADNQKRQAVDGIKGLTGALHKAADTLQGERQDMIARYAHLAADELDRLTTVLREKDWQDLVSETQSLARRQPTMFVAGAMVTGFLLARFLKSSGGEQAGQTGAYQNRTVDTSPGVIPVGDGGPGMPGEAV